MVIIDIVIYTLLGRVVHPAAMHCPAWDDAFVFQFVTSVEPTHVSSCEV